MGFFELTNRFFTLRVRARCLTCARRLAVEHAGAEGTQVWRDPKQTKIKVTGPAPDGRQEILERIEHEQSN